MFSETLYSALTTAPAVTALLGTSATRPDSSTGVWPTQAIDQPSMPYIVLSQASGESLSVLFSGTGALTTERWRISCYGTTYKNAKLLAKTVRFFLLSFGNSFVRLEADEAESIGKGTLFSTHLDFEFIYTDAS